MRACISLQGGNSLAEILVSLLLASVIMLLLSQYSMMLYARFVQMQSLMSRSTDVQLATDIMRDSVRLAGFTPCLSIEHLDVFDNRDGGTSLRALSVQGVLPYTELKIQRMSSSFSTSMQQIDNRRLFFRKNEEICEDYCKPLLISDCYHAEIQTGATFNGGIITLQKPLKFVYQAPVYVGAWISETFLIRKNKDGVDALFYKRDDVEELTSVIHGLGVNRVGRLVNVQFVLENQLEDAFTTMMREN